MLSKCALHDEKCQAGVASFGVPVLGDVRWSKIPSLLPGAGRKEVYGRLLGLVCAQ